MPKGSKGETRTVAEVRPDLDAADDSSSSSPPVLPVVGSRRISRSAACNVSHSACTARASTCFSDASWKSNESAARFISMRSERADSRSVWSSTRRRSSAARRTLSSSASRVASRAKLLISAWRLRAVTYLPVSAAARISLSTASRRVPASSSRRRVSMTFCVSLRSNKAEVASSSRKLLKKDSSSVVLPRPASPTTIRLKDSRPGSRELRGSTHLP
mmetsp:Transcript_10623/g.35284  ORF Transcript_10623/g.35284 Transcript_10623/m.35284 type:complete len:217 (+) Transcript_10623:2080-2730(+)